MFVLSSWLSDLTMVRLSRAGNPVSIKSNEPFRWPCLFYVAVGIRLEWMERTGIEPVTPCLQSHSEPVENG